MNHAIRQQATAPFTISHNPRIAIGGSILGGLVAIELLVSLVGHFA